MFIVSNEIIHDSHVFLEMKKEKEKGKEKRK